MFYFNPYAIPPFLAALLIIFLGIFVWHKNLKSSINFSWFLVCSAIFIWLIGDALLFSSNDYPLSIFFTHVVYLGVTATPFVNLYFSFKITKRPISTAILLLLSAIYLSIIYVVFNTALCINGFYKYYWGYYPKAGKFHEIYLIIWSTLYILSLTTLHKTIKQSKIQKSEKNRISFCFWAFLLGGIIGPIDFIQKYGIEFYPFGYFCVPLIIGFITYAIVKHNLMDIRIVLKKGITYSILITTITGIYLLLIMIIEHSFKGMLGYHSTITSLIFAFIIAIIFNPLRNKIQNIIDKVFLGKLPHEFARENELLKQELERSERFKAASTLALGLAHEVRNPLTTIKTFAEFLPEKYSDKDFINKFSKLIPAEVERINNIIHQLLTFSKPSPPSFKDANIHGLIKDVLGFLNCEFLKRKIKTSEDYHDSTLIIKIDPIQIKQALLNIILNAIDAMPNGGMLSMKTEIIRDSCFKIRISDTGCGISKEDLKHIFDPFYSKKDEGTGLGLAITHRIITNHNGTIEAESEVGKGTTFIITIPLTTKFSEISGE